MYKQEVETIKRTIVLMRQGIDMAKRFPPPPQFTSDIAKAVAELKADIIVMERHIARLEGMGL